VATFQMMSDVRAVIGPLLAGAIVAATKSYTLGFTVGAVVLVITFLLSATMPETLGRAKAQAATAPHLDDATEPEAGQP
jgi:MFS-type transporter involved in bile tolerance (Atg22 family)